MEESTSKAIQVVGRIPFLVAVGLRPLFPCWLSLRGCFSLKETCGLSSFGNHPHMEPLSCFCSLTSSKSDFQIQIPRVLCLDQVHKVISP